MNKWAEAYWWSHIEYMDSMSSAADFDEWFNYLNCIAVSTRELFTELWQIERTGYILIAIAVLILIIGIAILWNQRKIKKQLRQLLEQKEVTSSDEKTTIGEDDEMQ